MSAPGFGTFCFLNPASAFQPHPGYGSPRKRGSPVSSWAWSVTPRYGAYGPFHRPMVPSIPSQTLGSQPLRNPHFLTSVRAPHPPASGKPALTTPTHTPRPPSRSGVVGVACSRPSRCAVGCVGDSRAHEPSRVTHHFFLYPFIRASQQPGATVQADGRAGSGGGLALLPREPEEAWRRQARIAVPARPPEARSVRGGGGGGGVLPPRDPGCSPLGPGSCGS